MDIRLILVQVFVILFAITIHEAAHAWTANKMGDPTAAALGRASLNPLVHIDPLGTILLPAILIYFSVQTGGRSPVFGWAKPVPYNPYNLRRPRKGGLWISFAGPIANFLAALGSAALYQMLRLDQIRIVDPAQVNQPIYGLAIILQVLVSINVTLAFFNLIPIPPLDGSGILAGLLSERAAAQYERIRPYGFFFLILLMTTRVLDLIFIPARLLINFLLS
ncbi:MAG: site-2 protease family protein [Candidatus Aminicenantes bacterium]|jgi:Zn-dependent protease|nr:site-2 protease family protein [Candidatus Aminicenantes bacterium]